MNLDNLRHMHVCFTLNDLLEAEMKSLKFGAAFRSRPNLQALQSVPSIKSGIICAFPDIHLPFHWSKVGARNVSDSKLIITSSKIIH